ncbi:hypothetical protein WR25_04468 [Diploscapter pachys]|uniref:Alpha-mannosidase n=1 Tax=Diploscapter pachys TaxID=2018661 RepID=A0A2A2LG44_9BILA|nr:hypothetical protein WR25_04468 [Diploscapter pachys]
MTTIFTVVTLLPYRITALSKLLTTNTAKMRSCSSMALEWTCYFMVFLNASMVIKLGQILLLSACFVSTQCACSWDSCNPVSNDPKMINVHLVPHTHDDLGWLKTVDQYYYGSVSRITRVGVQYIYNTVIQELMYNSSRRFSFAETGFLWRWWVSHSPQDQDKLRQLIQNGQLEMIGGGWTQNDEAAAHYVDIIDQMTLGLRTLTDMFGDCGKPQAAWQIDPFGHSREMASIFAQMGYTSLSFARLHYAERDARLKNKSMEMIWNTSEDLKTSLFTGAFYKYDYNPPDGFCFDVTCGDDPIQDNPDLGDYNAKQKIDQFLDHVYKQANAQMTNNIMLLMGSDFHYTDANMWYVNMDKIIQHVNERNINVTVFYSTPSCYYKAVQNYAQAQKLTWPQKDDDFFPYANWDHSYWTGYFTSRPAYKGMIRDASALMQLTKALGVMGNLGQSDTAAIQLESMASGLAQHHDSVTGTAKQVVTYDYQMQLHRGMFQANQIISSFLGRMMAGGNSTSPNPVNASLCFIANETVCEASINNPSFQVTVFNTRPRWANETIRIPYYFGNATVKGPGAGSYEIKKSFQIQTLTKSSTQYAPYELHFQVQVPPYGFSTYSIDSSSSKDSVRARKAHKVLATTTMENQYIALTFDDSGALSQLKDKATNQVHNLQQQFMQYFGMDDQAPWHQPSGAYIFRPNASDPVDLGKPTHAEFSDGPLVKEMRQQFGSWIYQTIRLRMDKPYVEFDWVVGPIPTDAGKANTSREIVTRYSTDIQNGDMFYTDSSGRQMLKRQRNYAPTYTYQNTEPAAANYYPLTNRIFIKDGKSQMTVLLDRAEGGTAHAGDIEIMLHRRCFFDDHYGVDEALNEPGKDGKGLVVRGSHYLVFGDPKTAASVHRPLAVDIFHKPVVSYLAKGANTQAITQYSGLTTSLPANVHILTLEKWTDSSVLLRLEHTFQDGEDDQLSKPVTVDFGKLFASFDVVSVKELMLGANRNATTSQIKKMLRVQKGGTIYAAFNSERNFSDVLPTEPHANSDIRVGSQLENPAYSWVKHSLA